MSDDTDDLLDSEAMLRHFFTDWAEYTAINFDITKGHVPVDEFPMTSTVFDAIGIAMSDIIRPTMDETAVEIQKRLKDIPLYLISFAQAMAKMQVRNNQALLRLLSPPDA